MIKVNVINLIKYPIQQNEEAFRDEAYSIASTFIENEDEELGYYIFALLSAHHVFVPQEEITSLATSD